MNVKPEQIYCLVGEFTEGRCAGWVVEGNKLYSGGTKIVPRKKATPIHNTYRQT